MQNPTDLVLRNLSKSYDDLKVVDIERIEIQKGELFALLGPSGCGKSTTMRLIAGFERPDSGEIYLTDQVINYLPVHKRGIAMVFQDYALFPHMTVYENVAFGLRMTKVPKDRIALKVRDALDTVRLQGFETRYPRQLSGGQQQRVALARALIVEPCVLLLDEPLSNLDAKLREEMRVELKDLQRKINITTVFVTHDIQEAFALADRIAVMNHGRIMQIGTPSKIYNEPQNEFIATFVGQPNIFEGAISRIEGDEAFFESDTGLEIAVRWDRRSRANEKGMIILRPEKISISDNASPLKNCFSARIERKIFLGELNKYIVYIGGKRLLITSSRDFEEKRKVFVGWEIESCIFLKD